MVEIPFAILVLAGVMTFQFAIIKRNQLRILDNLRRMEAQLDRMHHRVYAMGDPPGDGWPDKRSTEGLDYEKAAQDRRLLESGSEAVVPETEPTHHGAVGTSSEGASVAVPAIAAPPDGQAKTKRKAT